MSELYTLPDEWEWIEFSKVFDTPSSKPYQIQKTEYLENGLLPIIDQGKEFIIGYTNSIEKKYLNESNCIIFGDHTRQIKYVDFDFVIGADGTKILKEKDKNKYDLKFLYFQFLSKKIESLGYSRHFKLVKEMFFAIPPPEEQKRIVAKLDILFAKIDKAIALHQKNIDEANVFMASVLNDVFVELEEKYGLDILSNSTLNPKKDIVDGPFGSNLKATEYIDSGIPIIRLQNIQRFEFIDKDIKFVSDKKAQQLQRHTFKSGDVVITKLGDPLGKSCIVPNFLNNGIIVADIIRVRVDELKSLTKYINYSINSPISINQFSNNSKGATRQRVKLTMVRDLKIPLPPFQTQQKVVSYLDEISQKMEKIKQIQKEKMQSLKALKASILDQAFKGEL